MKNLVSGAHAMQLAAGQSAMPAKAAVLLGGDASADDVVAKLSVAPRQTYHLKLKLQTYGYAKTDEAGPLESNTLGFQVE